LPARSPISASADQRASGSSRSQDALREAFNAYAPTSASQARETDVVRQLAAVRQGWPERERNSGKWLAKLTVEAVVRVHASEAQYTD
jgi:hypothetical protein